ncbi:hypothetical protein Tco_0623448 [Tanacetum coccineum]
MSGGLVKGHYAPKVNVLPRGHPLITYSGKYFSCWFPDLLDLLSGCGGGGSVEVVLVVVVKLEGTPADAVRALKKLVCFRLSTSIL